MARDRDRQAPRQEAVEAPAAPASAPDAALDVEAKIKQIEASGLSDAEKKSYIDRLRGDVVDPMAADRIPFNVYANIKKIRSHVRKGMLLYPPAKGKETATVEEWETIFKDF